MVKLDFSVENVKEVAAALAQIEDLPKYFAPQFRDWAGRTTSTHLWGMKNYAPAPPGSEYQRTGRFGSSWGYHEVGPSQASFENTHEAASLIVGEDQAWMHRGRWWQAYQRIEEHVMDLLPLLIEALGKWPK